MTSPTFAQTEDPNDPNNPFGRYKRPRLSSLVGDSGLPGAAEFDANKLSPDRPKIGGWREAQSPIAFQAQDAPQVERTEAPQTPKPVSSSFREPPPGVEEDYPTQAQAPPQQAQAQAPVPQAAPVSNVPKQDNSTYFQDQARKIAEHSSTRQRPDDIPKSNWAQRLGMTVLSLSPRIAPYAQQIMHPKWTEQMEASQMADKRDLAQMSGLEKAANTAQLEEQRSATADERRAKADALRNPQPKRATNILEWYQQAHPNATPEEFATFEQSMKDPKKQDLMDWWRKVNPNGTPEQYQEFMLSGKADKADTEKQVFQKTLTKLSAEGSLPPDATSDVRRLSQAIQNSRTLTPEEKNSARAYLAANTTPASQTSAGVMRMEVLGQQKEYPVINRNTKQLEMRNSTEINHNPGLYAPAGEGAKAMGKGSVFEDLDYNIQTARNALHNIPEIDTGTRAALSYILRHTHPDSALQSFLTGTAGTQLNDQQRELVQSLALLAENAMTLRGVSGMGQGSDELRQAILATIPSAKSADKNYALGQLDKFEQVVKRLKGGVPGMGATEHAPTQIKEDLSKLSTDELLKRLTSGH